MPIKYLANEKEKEIKTIKMNMTQMKIQTFSQHKNL